MSPAEIRSNIHVDRAIEAGIAYNSLRIEYNNNLKLAQGLGLIEDDSIGKVPLSLQMQRLDAMLVDNLLDPYVERKLNERREVYQTALSSVGRYGENALNYVDSKVQESLTGRILL